MNTRTLAAFERRLEKLEGVIDALVDERQFAAETNDAPRLSSVEARLDQARRQMNELTVHTLAA
jgi:hypothetical protein